MHVSIKLPINFDSYNCFVFFWTYHILNFFGNNCCFFKFFTHYHNYATRTYNCLRQSHNMEHQKPTS